MREEPATLLLRSYRHPPEGTLAKLYAARFRVILALAGVFGIDTARVCMPVPQPRRIAASSRGGTPEPRASPDPAMDLDALLERLESVEDVGKFLANNAAYRGPSGAVEFLWEYRQEPRNFQEKAWRGPCNNFAEFAGTWVLQRGGIPYVVSLCPRGLLPKAREDWHQFLACKRTDGILIVFDNRSVLVSEESLEKYLAREHPAMTIAPVGGIIRWKKVQNDPRAKLLQHILLPSLASGEEMEEADIPLVPGEEPASLSPVT